MPDPPEPESGAPSEGDGPKFDPFTGIPLPPQNEGAEEMIGEAVDRHIQRTQQDVDPYEHPHMQDTEATTQEIFMHHYEEEAALGMLEQDAATGKSGAAAFAAATVLVAAVGVGVWVANNGSEDSTEAVATTVESDSSTTESSDETTPGAAVVDPASQPALGERWLVYAKYSQGYREYHNFDTYFAASLVFADGQDYDTQHPRYVVESGHVLFTDVDQPDGPTGCAYSGAASFNAVDPSHILVKDKAGYLEFDLTKTPDEYWAQIVVRGLTRPLTYTCPETVSTHDYGDSMVLVDTYRSEEGFLKIDSTGQNVLFDGFAGGTAGYVDSVWIILPCEPDICDAYLDVLGDEKMSELIDQAITDAILEGL